MMGIWNIIYRQYVILSVFLILIQGNGAFCFGQGGYNLSYDQGKSLRFFSIEYFNEHLFIAGIHTLNPGAFQEGFIASFDTLGSLIHWSAIIDDLSPVTLNEESSHLICDSNIIAIPHGILHRPSIGMIRVDINGDILSMNEYDRPAGSVTSPRDITKVEDGYLITGWTTKLPDYLTDAFVLKTDLEGNQLWFRRYGLPGLRENPRTITVVDPNFYLISGTRYIENQTPRYYRGWAVAIDSLGNVLWEWVADPEDVPHEGVIAMQYDSERREWIYVTTLRRPTMYPDRDYDLMAPYYVRRDSNMQLIDYREYGPYAINHYFGVLEQSRDGGWIAAGRTTRTTDDYISPVSSASGRVVKLSYDGTLEWSVIDTAFYDPVLGSSSYLSGITESPTGSIYAVGWARKPDELGVDRSFGWLLKITADGCVDTLCTTTSLLDHIDRLQNPVRIYPNPAHDYVTIDAVPGMKEAARIHFYEITGRIISSRDILPGQTTIDTRSWPQGVYLWKVVQGDGVALQTGKLVIQ